MGEISFLVEIQVFDLIDHLPVYAFQYMQYGSRHYVSTPWD